MPWLQIKFFTSPEQAAEIEDLLLESGCASVTLLDAADTPVYEPEKGSTPLWQHTIVMGLYEDNVVEQAIVDHVRDHLVLADGQTFPPYKSEILEDKEWERAWMDHFHPIQFGKRLWVCPSWREVPDPTATNLMLDPGLAFGTGTHQTTALCLEWLESLNLTDLDIIDYGCGSGILGIAGLLLGARHMIGVDNDSQALIATRDNAKRNHIEDSRVEIYLPDDCPPQQADVVVANILAGPLVTLAPTIASCVKPGGLLAMSGLFERHVDSIMLSYAPWIEFSPYATKEGWVRLNGVRRITE
ncbi:50S ribosomal protein L11 methyltransferase [Gynuella sp.]|uniref:50S ribosomal protein L11 methyltransferase n=1 Tax=Gynuella sp. TaxID=2969146 RepID=UPI003D0EFF86